MDMTSQQAQQIIALLQQILNKLNQIAQDTDYLKYRV